MNLFLAPQKIDVPVVSPPPKALTVAEVIGRIRQLIEGQFPLPLWIEGEISNCTYAASGHIYFSLVDERAGQRFVLPCAFFKPANTHVRFKLTNGLKILCYGQVTVYEARSQYQVRVLRVEPKGIGALQLAFDQLKKRLEAEGLFAPERKRALPRFVSRIGVVTSLSGSAVHDIVSKLKDQFHVILVPTKVQGEGAAAEIAQALDVANHRQIADILIVGRGGGSVEDLWAFNEEPVARAIARSRIPVISAVGHQDDWTIADYVADVRASTPTDAAKRLTQDRQALVDDVRELVRQLLEGMQGFLDDQTSGLEALTEQLRLLHPQRLLAHSTQRVQELLRHLIQSTEHALDREDRQLRLFVGRLQALSPLAVLGRGYSITTTHPEGRVVTDARRLRVGQALDTLLARGRLRSTVTDTLEGGDDGAG